MIKLLEQTAQAEAAATGSVSEATAASLGKARDQLKNLEGDVKESLKVLGSYLSQISSIRNVTTGMFMQFLLTMVPGDVLYINTQSGFIKAALNGADVLKKLTLQSRMVQVESGNNTLLFEPDQGADRAGCEISFRGKVAGI
ncbi:hypothetical protein KL86DPRO_10296 [uncultured delta proteobacterium]|uniref:Siphovirus-type tail component C-terminal domain-containing protein n=1 Tax=uncultured delta proteobacterium TaxID=34034 RepID=A0A212IXY7_9DELT|nr:hypothetical protein KL86DPRO_10296 [uncultured delta proteobacterium]